MKALFLALSTLTLPLMAAEHTFVENGQLKNLEWCGKYQGSAKTENNILVAKRGITNCCLVASRSINEKSAFEIKATFEGEGTFYFGSPLKATTYQMKITNGITFKQGEAKSRLFKEVQTGEKVELLLTSSDGENLSISINGKEVLKKAMACHGYFGFYLNNKKEPLKIHHFQADLAQSALVPPQACRSMGKTNDFSMGVHNKANSARNCNVMLIGDSITDAFDGDARFIKGDANKSGKLAWDTLDNPVNAGVGSDRTYNTLWRVKNMDWAKIKPKNIILMIGINNIASKHTPKDTAKGIEMIVRHLEKESPGSNIFVYDIFPTRRSHLAPNRKLTNELLKKVQWGKNTRHISLESVLTDEQGLLNKAYTFDGVHLSAEGFKVWAEDIKKRTK